ncbi:hypothetical protein [Melissospora conviva]|uniref:hypothetical protein n=1 Tax=Melissospora conviva TaxID=3388432 RepID=UPI003B78F3BD
MTHIRTLTVVGLPEQVANVIRNHRAAGTLIAMTVPRPVSATDPRVRVGIRLAQPLPSVQVDSIGQYIADRHRTRNHTRRVALVVALTAAAVAVIAAGAWIVAQVVAFITAHAALIVGAIVLAAIAAGLLITATTSGKRHCPGC